MSDTIRDNSRECIEVDPEKILSEQAKLLFKASPLSIWGTFLGIIYIVVVLWSVADRITILSWAISFSVVNVIRLMVTLYNYRLTDQFHYKSWVRKFSIFAVIYACFWGSAGLLLFPVGEPVYQLMLAFILVTTSAIAMTNISMLLNIILIYIAITLGPLIIRFAIATHEAMTMSAIMVAAAMLLLLSAAYRINRSILETITIRIRDQETAEQLKESQDRLTLHIHNTPLAVIELNKNMMITQWNTSAQKIFGYSESEVLGKNIIDLLVLNSSREKALQVKEMLLTQSGGTHVSYENSTKFGDTILCEWFNTPLVDNNGTLIGFASLAQDITERSRIDKMKDDFISIISHELRTPLTSLQGSLNLVVAGATGELPDKAKEFLTIAEQNAERLTDLINDILDIQNIASGAMKFDMQKTNLVELINKVVKDNQDAASKANISLITEFPNEAINSLITPNRIQQVMNNLISNAIKFSPANTTVRISSEVHNATVAISVQDEGPGIPKEFQPKLFSKFTQLESASTRNFSGSGLGLAICKGIIERHGGRIYYQDAPGGGSCFRFELSLA